MSGAGNHIGASQDGRPHLIGSRLMWTDAIAERSRISSSRRNKTARASDVSAGRRWRCPILGWWPRLKIFKTGPNRLQRLRPRPSSFPEWAGTTFAELTNTPGHDDRGGDGSAYDPSCRNAASASAIGLSDPFPLAKRSIAQALPSLLNRQVRTTSRGKLGILGDVLDGGS